MPLSRIRNNLFRYLVVVFIAKVILFDVYLGNKTYQINRRNVLKGYLKCGGK